MCAALAFRLLDVATFGRFVRSLTVAALIASWPSFQRFSVFAFQRFGSYAFPMPLLGHGIDLVECRRIAEVLERHGHRFLERILTPKERDIAARYKDPVPFIAGRWAAKEAILKMIGTGWRGTILWTDMEILPDALGQPVVMLSGQTARIAREKGIERMMLSITHTKEHAAASVMGISE